MGRIKNMIREGIRDRRLYPSLAVDAYGAASTLGYATGAIPGLAGDLIDPLTAAGQTAYIAKMYGDDLVSWQKKVLYAASFAEEALPGIFDLVPSATVAHFIAAYNRANGVLDRDTIRIRPRELR